MTHSVGFEFETPAQYFVLRFELWQVIFSDEVSCNNKVTKREEDGEDAI